MQNISHEAILEGIRNLALGRPFNPKYRGACALTGIKFEVWDKVRAVETSEGTAWVKQGALKLINAVYTGERQQRFTAELAQRWLEDSCTFLGEVTVFSRTGLSKTWKIRNGKPQTGSGGPCSWKQFASRNSGSCYMTRGLAL